jgi:hypothetical protein
MQEGVGRHVLRPRAAGGIEASWRPRYWPTTAKMLSAKSLMQRRPHGRMCVCREFQTVHPRAWLGCIPACASPRRDWRPRALPCEAVIQSRSSLFRSQPFPRRAVPRARPRIINSTFGKTYVTKRKRRSSATYVTLHGGGERSFGLNRDLAPLAERRRAELPRTQWNADGFASRPVTASAALEGQ